MQLSLRTLYLSNLLSLPLELAKNNIQLMIEYYDPGNTSYLH